MPIGVRHGAAGHGRAGAGERGSARGLIGGVLIVVGLAAAAFAAYGNLADDGPRPIGRLIGTDLDAVAAGAGAGAGADPGSATTTATPAPTGEPQWPVAVQGRPPAFGADGDAPPASAGDLAPGFYLWSDFQGWHAWIVGGQGSDASLEVVTNDAMLVTPAGGEPQVDTAGDRFTLRRGGEDADVVGVDFNPGFFVQQLDVTVTGDLPLLTGFGAAPASSPLVLRYEPQG